MSFQKGNFVNLIATTTIHLGKLERNLSKDDVVEFDGFELKIAGKTVMMPELKAGVKRGWLKILDPSSEIPSPVKKEKPSPKKEMVVQKVYDEERAVSEIKKKDSPKKEPKEKKKFQIVREQENDMVPVGKIKSAKDVKRDTPADQDAEFVGSIKLKTPSKMKTVITNSDEASAEIVNLDNMSAPIVKKASKPSVDEQSIEDAQLLQAIEGNVKPDQGAITVGKDNSKMKSLPVGVDWDMSPHWSKRASIAVERYSSHPDILDAIKAVESKGVVKAINKALNS